MATITFAIASAPLTGQKVFTGTDQEMQDILNWAKVAYDPIVQELFNPGHAVGFVPTNLQIGVALSTGTMRAWDQASRKQKKDADLAAVPTPPPGSWS